MAEPKSSKGVAAALMHPFKTGSRLE